MLSDHCPVCPVLSVYLSVTLVHMWPNGWTDQNATWCAGRHRPWPHCVRWGPSSPSRKGHSPQFSAHICCGQMAAWIKMSLGMEVGLGPGDFVLDGDPAPLPKKGEPPILGPCLLWPNSWVNQDGTWHGDRPELRRLCVRWGPSPLAKKGAEPPPNKKIRLIFIVTTRLDGSRWHLAWR